VTIYSGASILGGETVIGEGVVIGSNAFIISSVQENTKVKVGYKCGQLGSSVLCYISRSLNQINSKKMGALHI